MLSSRTKSPTALDNSSNQGPVSTTSFLHIMFMKTMLRTLPITSILSCYSGMARILTGTRRNTASILPLRSRESNIHLPVPWWVVMSRYINLNESEQYTAKVIFQGCPSFK
jgi:hypothetical protein